MFKSAPQSELPSKTGWQNSKNLRLSIKLLAVFLIGAFSALSMAPNSFWPAIFFGLSSLYIMVERASTPSRAALFTFIFSLGYFSFSLSWIGNALLVEDNPYWWMWPFAVSGLPIILAIFPAICIGFYKALTQRYIKHKNSVLNYIAFCLCLALSDYARGHFFTGFPWNLYGYTWSKILPIAQLASLPSIYFLNTVTIFWGTAPAFILSKQKNKIHNALFIIFIIISFITAYLYGYSRINSYNSHPSENVKLMQVIVVQPNIKQSDKWKKEKRSQNFIDLVEMSHYRKEALQDINYTPKQTIIIWPETAISQDIIETTWTMNQIRGMLKTYPGDVYLIAGTMRYLSQNKDDPKTFYNSIITLNKNGEVIDIYDKKHLVPFGEYIPLDSYIKLSPVVGFSGFKKGNKPNLRIIETNQNDVNKGNTAFKFIALICYEAIFPRYVHMTYSEKPDFIVNVTNDAWYGNSVGPYQHAVQAQFRAIESRLPFIRSANTGISMVADRTGKIISKTELMKKNILRENFILPID
ncbi:MAG: apolipoprotein N-acyltransferase [Alphaproteobacteria bacterium]|nr:apolipoprotein N-acyltransferase [Alphaproteobacteria bacterium]